MSKISFFRDLIKGKRARYCSALLLGISKCGFEIFEAYLTSLIIDDVIGKGQYKRIGPIIGIFLAAGTLHMTIWNKHIRLWQNCFVTAPLLSPLF